MGMSVKSIATPLATKELEKKVYKMVETLNTQDFVKKGNGECVKNINRKKAHLIIIAADAEPIEIVANIPELCKVKDVPYVFVSSKANLGSACGLQVPCIAAAIISKDDSTRSKID